MQADITFPSADSDVSIPTVHGIQVVTDLETALNTLVNDTVIGFDLETTGFSAWRDSIAVVQLYGEQTGTLAVLQVRGTLPAKLKDLFLSSDKTFIGHNIASFDLVFLATHGVDILAMPKVFDTLVAEAVVTSTSRRDVSKSLGASIRRQLGMEIKKEYDHSQSWMGELSQSQIEYAASDVLALPGLMRAQMNKAQITGQSEALSYEMEIVPAVARMTYNGFPVDRQLFDTWRELQKERQESALAKLQAAFGRLQAEKLAEFYTLLDSKAAQKELAKGTFLFNPRSPAQVLAWAKVLGLKINKTDAEAMGSLLLRGGKSAEFANLLLDFRVPNKRLENFPDTWYGETVEWDGCCHPRFKQLGTATGRFSSANPNGQNFSKDMRHVFQARAGYKIVDADYEQVELLALGEVAPDAHLVAAYASGQDLHRANAAAMFRCAPEDVTKAMRSKAKGASFGASFGGDGATLEANAIKMVTKNREEGIHDIFTLEEAEDLVSSFYRAFPGVELYKRRAQAMARSHGPVTLKLPFGLLRYLVGTDKRYTVIMNTLVQGRVAAGVKQAIRYMQRDGLIENICGPIHDEFVAQVPEGQAEEYSRQLQEDMIKGMATVLRTPVRVESRVGPSW